MHDVKSAGVQLRATALNSTLSRSVAGSVYILNTDAQFSANFDWSSVAGGLAIDFTQSNSQPGSLRDLNPGGAAGSYNFLTKRVRSYNSAANISAWDSYLRANAGGGAFALTLPDTASPLTKSQEITFRKVDSGRNAVTIQGTNGQKINGATNIALVTPSETVKLREANRNWERVDQPATLTTPRILNGVDGTIIPHEGITCCIKTNTSVTATLPPMASAAGRLPYTIYEQVLPNTVTMNVPDGSIRGVGTSVTLTTDGEAVRLQCDGTNWVIV